MHLRKKQLELSLHRVWISHFERAQVVGAAQPPFLGPVCTYCWDHPGSPRTVFQS